jgi:hypothetical protein
MTTIIGTPVSADDGYATVAEVKTFLGISGTAQDTQIASLIIAMQETFNSILGIDSLLADDYEEVVAGHDDYYLRLRNFNVTAIDTIEEFAATEDSAVTGWTVRRIEGRTVWFDTTFTKGIRYLVSYSAGVNTISSSVKLAIAYMVGGALSGSEGKGEGIKSYSIFGKSVTFRDDSEYDKFKSVIDKYARMYSKAEVFAI